MNTTELKALAEKATPGPWHRMANKDFGPISADEDQSFGMFIDCGSAHSDEDANFIAAANPAAILELIAQLEDAQGEIRALRATEAVLRERVEELEEGVRWYGEQSRLCRLVHSEGESGRNALSNDGGRKARALLEKKE